LSSLLSLTDADVQAICRIWQARLRLQDWDIHCQLVRGFRLTEAVAEVESLETKRVAWIRVMNPLDFQPDSLLPQDVERSIVHELLHLVLSPLAPGEATLAEEQIVNTLSATLVSLWRSRPDLAPPPSPTLVNPSPLPLLGVTFHAPTSSSLSGSEPDIAREPTAAQASA
jgi:hypothetical protein